MDEQTLNQQQTTPLASQSSVQAAPRTDLPNGVYDYSEQIASMYDAQQRAKEQSLANAYEQNVATLERDREKISPLYQTQANDLSTQYERNRRNMNFQADLNGLNTGTASQMGLAQNNTYMKGYGQLRAGEAEALRAADQQAADLEIGYKNAISQALADNDYQKATALMSEYQRRDAAATAMEQYNKEQQAADAKLKAAYGDFSGYADIYGKETAQSMYKYWLYNNPDYAYANGLMSANDYYIMTGRYPSGYAVAKSSGGYSNRGGGVWNNNDKPEAEETPETPTVEGKELSNEKQLALETGINSGVIAAQELATAYTNYTMLQRGAAEIIRANGGNPNSPEGKKAVEAYVEASYNDPNVSYSQVSTLAANRTTKNQAEAQAAASKRKDNSTWTENALIGLNNMGV